MGGELPADLFDPGEETGSEVATLELFRDLTGNPFPDSSPTLSRMARSPQIGAKREKRRRDLAGRELFRILPQLLSELVELHTGVAHVLVEVLVHQGQRDGLSQ